MNFAIKVFLVDSQTVVREGIALLLQQRGKIAVVGASASWRQAIVQAAPLKPKVIVVDFRKVNLGVDGVRALRAALPQARILLLSAQSPAWTITELVRAGASGFVSKLSPSSELIQAVRRVAAGGIVLSEELAREFAGQTAAAQARKAPGEQGLTGREEEILRLIACGYTHKRAAEHLGISQKTVEIDRQRGMGKIRAAGKPDLIQFALESGWLPA